MLKSSKYLKFIYDKPALILTAGKREHLIIGDLHIGTEKKMLDKGIHLYTATQKMAKSIIELGDEFSVDSVVLLGDVKESILYPDEFEKRLLVGFFKELDKHFDVKVILGNHDAHLNEAISESCSSELLLERAALLHGNRWPSEEAMKKEIIITAHNHIAVMLFDRNDALYREKAWLIAPIEKRSAAKFYKTPKAKKLVVVPAYNDLILGMPVNKMSRKENINPLLRNGVFEYKNAEIYTLGGESLGTVGRLKAKTAL